VRSSRGLLLVFVQALAPAGTRNRQQVKSTLLHAGQVPPEQPYTVGLFAALLGGNYYGEILAGASAATREAGTRLIAVQTVRSWVFEALEPIPIGAAG
jgi:hypothetical protein